jgi:predicted DNA-binding protein
MRPNIQISHQLNGRVKDYAAKHDLTTGEAYKQIIKAGLEELEDDGSESATNG